MHLEALKKLNKFLRVLSPICWLAVIAVGLWGFWSLQGIGEVAADGSPRTTLDRLAPYFFLLFVPFGAYMARKEYIAVRQDQLRDDAEEEKTRERRRRARERSNTPPLLSGEIKSKARATLDQLKSAGVIGEDEIDADTFLDLCQSCSIESSDLYEVSNILAQHAEAHGDFANLMFIPNQVEVHDADLKAMIEGFARLAGRSADLTDLAVTVSNPRKGGADGSAQFTLAGTATIIRFEYHNKYPSNSLMQALVTTFDPTPPYALAFFGSVFMVTRLNDLERSELNTALDPDGETFERL